MEEEMIKDKKANEYFMSHPAFMNSEEAFKAGWEAAYDHLCEKPFDEMIEELSEYLKSKDNGKSE